MVGWAQTTKTSNFRYAWTWHLWYWHGQWASYQQTFVLQMIQRQGQVCPSPWLVGLPLRDDPLAGHGRIRETTNSSTRQRENTLTPKRRKWGEIHRPWWPQFVFVKNCVVVSLGRTDTVDPLVTLYFRSRKCRCLSKRRRCKRMRIDMVPPRIFPPKDFYTGAVNPTFVRPTS